MPVQMWVAVALGFGAIVRLHSAPFRFWYHLPSLPPCPPPGPSTPPQISLLAGGLFLGFQLDNDCSTPCLLIRFLPLCIPLPHADGGSRGTHCHGESRPCRGALARPAGATAGAADFASQVSMAGCTPRCSCTTPCRLHQLLQRDSISFSPLTHLTQLSTEMPLPLSILHIQQHHAYPLTDVLILHLSTPCLSTHPVLQARSVPREGSPRPHSSSCLRLLLSLLPASIPPSSHSLLS